MANPTNTHISCSGGSEVSRRCVLDAVFALVVEGGIAEVSFRKVADASGVNIGSVRHYFGSHSELLRAAVEEVGRRMENRLSDVAASVERDTPSGRNRFVEAIAMTLLPTDRSLRDEFVVIFEFITAARVLPELRDAATQMGRDMRAVIADALMRAGVHDVEFESERLVALTDGLTFEMLYPHGFETAGAMAEETVRAHIRSVIS
jgi:AcrR family transcriptional regulator